MEIKWKKIEDQEEFFKLLESGLRVRVESWPNNEFLQIKDDSVVDDQGSILQIFYHKGTFKDDYVCDRVMYVEDGTIPNIDLDEIFEALDAGKKIIASDWAEDEFVAYDANGHLVDETSEKYPVKHLIERYYLYPQLEIKQ